MSTLDDIQQLQFTDLDRAQELARIWLNDTFHLDVESVVLRPSAVSLNSFNGIATLAGADPVFFKSHTEPGSVVKEYYNNEILADAGYNTLMPKMRGGEFGAQIMLYPVIESSTLFETCRSIEVGESRYASARDVLDAESKECSRLLEIYSSTANQTDAAENVDAPVYQLLWHRLTGGRLDAFYTNSIIQTPDGRSIPFSRVRSARWIVNGVEQPRSLQQLIEEAIAALDPNRSQLTVIGHGDAHYGNVFLEEGEFMYFDPAFAGRYSPLLDVVKPLAHNTLLQPWLYFPDDAAKEIAVEMQIDGDTIRLDYPTYGDVLRSQLWHVKQRELIEPLLAWLDSEGQLLNGRRMMDLALMCCPLLTMNLSDHTRYPSVVAWLGLALATQFGNGDIEQDFSLASVA